MMKIPGSNLRPIRIYGILGILLLFPLLTRAQDAGTTVTGSHLFSYQAPAGWTVQTATDGSYPTAADVQDDAPKGMISVNVNSKVGPLEEWCKNSIALNKAMFAKYNVQMGELQPFVTTAGLKGFRETINLTNGGKKLQFVMYYFAGGTDAKIVASCTSSAEDAAHYAPLFDSAMKTFVLLK